jgi:hypothetical protein
MKKILTLFLVTSFVATSQAVNSVTTAAVLTNLYFIKLNPWWGVSKNLINLAKG